MHYCCAEVTCHARDLQHMMLGIEGTVKGTEGTEWKANLTFCGWVHLGQTQAQRPGGPSHLHRVTCTGHLPGMPAQAAVTRGHQGK